MAYRFGDFTLDDDIRQLSLARTEVHLSPKAYELLTGARPFDAPTREERMALVLGARDLGAPMLADVPDALASLVRASLIRDRHARPTMRDFERVLDAPRR